MMKIALGRIVDDVFQADVDRRAAELYWKDLIRFVAQAVEEQRVNGSGFFADQAGERSAFGAVSFAGRAQAAEEIDLKFGRLRKFVGRQLCRALIEIVGDAHRANGVRTR